MGILSSKPDSPIGERARVDYFYLQIKDKSLTLEEIMGNDLTNDFLESLKFRIKHGQLITITIRGETALGKSTLALYFKKFINDLLIKAKKRECKDEKERDKLEYYTILSDQIEAVRFFMKDERNICILIDEYSTMSQSGENATTEQGLYLTYSDIFAQRFCHRIQCTPRAGSVFDTTSTYILDVQATDKKKGTTLAILYYNDPTSSRGIPFPLGYLRIDVNDLIKKWREVEFISRKKNKTSNEEKLIKEKGKDDFYIRYMSKKFKRMDLMDEKGVRDIRELERSKIILEVYNRCKKGVNGIDKELYRGALKIQLTNYLREQKILTYSMIGKASTIEDIDNMLSILHSIQKTKLKYLNPYKPVDEFKKEMANASLREYKRQLKERIEGLEKDVRILEEYLSIK
jgi:hypothetical protein